MSANATTTPQFGAVFIGDIRKPKTVTAGATEGMIVVYHQQCAGSAYTTSAGKQAANVTSGVNKEKLRKFSEFWSMDELSQANDGTGLNLGDELPGISISSLNSATPFYTGQTAFVDSKGVNRGYYSPVLEFGDQPNDRVEEQAALVVASDTADMAQAGVTAPAGAVVK